MGYKRLFLLVMSVLFTGIASAVLPTKWTLKNCIDYALENNITVKTGKLSVLSSAEDVKAAGAGLFPSLSFSTNHQGGYRPFADRASGAVDKSSYSGDYGLNASWIVWDGNKNRNNVKLQKVINRQYQLSLDESLNSIREQILKLYVQILYVKEAVEVNARILDISRHNADRGKQMYAVGSISKADLSQLDTQVATDEYNLVNIKGMLEDYKLQMKELLELDYDDDFDVADPVSTDAQALEAPLPVKDVLERALISRPEVRNALLGIESGNINVDIAKAGCKPTVGLSGGIGSNSMTGTDNAWGTQMKSNFSGSLGVTLSVPIFDNRSAKTAVNKAKNELQKNILEAEDVKDELAFDIQGFWINASTNQQRFRSAQVSVKSAQDSYDLLSEQFRLGLKNIVELTNAKTVLLNAQQSRLESKYTAILYLQLLKFYNEEELNLI